MVKPNKRLPGLESTPAAVTPPRNSPAPFPAKPKLSTSRKRRRDIPEGLWNKCPKCESMLYDKELETLLNVCPKCDHHFSFSAKERIQQLIDAGTFVETHPHLSSVDSLQFTGTSSYASKLDKHQKTTGLRDAVITGTGNLDKHKIALAVMDFSFLGGSMGSVVGEKITRIIELATSQKIPVIIVSSSGGARMYEGMFSLMQMAKTSAALAYHAQKKLPFISILTHPTTAGVMASYASLGDLIISEPQAMIGFAGPRVIKDTTQAELPPGFQTAEFLLERGLLDAIVKRSELKSYLSHTIGFLRGES